MVISEPFHKIIFLICFLNLAMAKQQQLTWIDQPGFLTFDWNKQYIMYHCINYFLRNWISIWGQRCNICCSTGCQGWVQVFMYFTFDLSQLCFMLRIKCRFNSTQILWCCCTVCCNFYSLLSTGQVELLGLDRKRVLLPKWRPAVCKGQPGKPVQESPKHESDHHAGRLYRLVA